MQQTLSF